jgi:1,4-alpha-glucan branching enzyme
MQQEVCHLFGRIPEDITIIPNGVDPELFTTLPAKPRFNISGDEKVVFFIGRLVPEKGVWQLINCFPQVLKEVPEAFLYIGGRGPQKPVLDKLARDLGILDRVLFPDLFQRRSQYVYDQARSPRFPVCTTVWYSCSEAWQPNPR